MSRLDNLRKQFAVDAIDDFFNVKISVRDIHRAVKPFVI